MTNSLFGGAQSAIMLLGLNWYAMSLGAMKRLRVDSPLKKDLVAIDRHAMTIIVNSIKQNPRPVDQGFAEE